MAERRYSELTYEARADGPGVVRGNIVTYGDVAQLPWGREKFTVGAFAGVESSDSITANVQHDRGRLLAATGGGGLVVTDTPRALRAELSLPDTLEGRDTATLLRRRVLRGISAEFHAREERQERGMRVISLATLSGLAIVDKGAYPLSIPTIRAEVRQVGPDGLEGAFFYGVDTVVSDRSAAQDHEERQRAGVRKSRVQPGAFRLALEDPGREVSLVLGHSYDQPLASKLGGTLELTDTPEALRFRVERLPSTSYVADFKAQQTSGAAVFGVRPLYRVPPSQTVPDAVSIIPEPDGEPGVMIEVVNEAVLTGLSIVSRAPRGNPGQVSGQRPRRRRLWL